MIDLHWHDLRHEGASRLLADRVDIRIIQLMLGHAGPTGFEDEQAPRKQARIRDSLNDTAG